MSRTFSAVCAGLLTLGAAHAQTQPPRSPMQPTGISPAAASLQSSKTPPPAKVEPATPPHFTSVKFDPRDTSVRLVDGRWQLWAGRELLKDFGAQHVHALEARKLVAELQLTEHARLGAPEPVMEFWLAGGRPPPITSTSRTVIPFEPSTLKAEAINGAYWIRDRSKMLYNFGPYRADAEHGLKLLQQFGFNEVAFVGSPNPTMSYLVKNDQPGLLFGRSDPLTMQTLPQTVQRHPLQLYRLGTVGERQPFDPMKLEIRRSSDGWRLAAGVRDLENLGVSEHQARTALQIAQSYPFNELCRVGKGNLSFYLSRGAAPRGVPLGIRRTPFNPQSLTVKASGDTQQIVDGNRVIAQFNGSGDDAQLAVKVLQYYQFDSLCEVGQLRYFAKER